MLGVTCGSLSLDRCLRRWMRSAVNTEAEIPTAAATEICPREIERPGAGDGGGDAGVANEPSALLGGWAGNGGGESGIGGEGGGGATTTGTTTLFCTTGAATDVAVTPRVSERAASEDVIFATAEGMEWIGCVAAVAELALLSLLPLSPLPSSLLVTVGMINCALMSTEPPMIDNLRRHAGSKHDRAALMFSDSLTI